MLAGTPDLKIQSLIYRVLFICVLVSLKCYRQVKKLLLLITSLSDRPTNIREIVTTPFKKEVHSLNIDEVRSLQGAEQLH